MARPSSTARKGLEKLPIPTKTTVTLHVNGVERKLTIAPWTTLLDASVHRFHTDGTLTVTHLIASESKLATTTPDD